jgi:hypothetical protein
MANNTQQVGPIRDLGGLSEAVCIHTRKIYDSCLDKDCIEDLRVYLTADSQEALERATTVKARSAELLHAYIDVEPVSFNKGFYTVDVTYYYRIVVDLLVGLIRPFTAYGLAVFSKRAMLYGGEGSAKIFSSKAVTDGFDPQNAMRRNQPEAVVEAVDPLILSARTVDVCDCCRCDCDVVELPEAVGSCFDSDLVFSSEGKQLYVTLGQFSIIRLERDSQLLIPSFDDCIPQKECSATGSATEETPCEMFEQIEFPVDDFFPPQNSTRTCGCGSAVAGTSICNAVAGTTTGNSSNGNSSNGSNSNSSRCGCRS